MPQVEVHYLRFCLLLLPVLEQWQGPCVCSYEPHVEHLLPLAYQRSGTESGRVRLGEGYGQSPMTP